MQTSSPRQLEIDDSNGGSSQQDQPTSPSAASATFRVPDFGSHQQAYAVTARMAGRINAASVPEKEHTALLDERQRLLDKVFNETITKEESNRLEYVRWSLDRIEDAKHGQVLDFLESAVVEYERLLSDIHKLDQSLRQHTKKSKHR